MAVVDQSHFMKLDALSFEDLRSRWGIAGRPLPERTARRYARQIGRLRLGRGHAYPRRDVERWEQQRKEAV
jgi:hypothetical protein